MRNKAFGGDQSEVGDRVVAQLIDLAQGVHALGKDKPKQPKTDPVAQQLTKLNKTLATLGGGNNAEVNSVIAERLAEMCTHMQTSMGSAKKQDADDRMVVLFARLVKSVQEISAQKQEHVNDRIVSQIAELVHSVHTLRMVAEAGQGGKKLRG